MKFQWDAAKDKANQVKHGISFTEAQAIFLDTRAVTVQTPYELEERFLTIGSLNNRIWAAFYTMRDSDIRLISVRRARAQEEKLYE